MIKLTKDDFRERMISGKGCSGDRKELKRVEGKRRRSLMRVGTGQEKTPGSRNMQIRTHIKNPLETLISNG